MVTSIPFYSFKDIDLRRTVPFWAVLLIVLALLLISYEPPVVLFLLFCTYALSGYAYWVWNFRKLRNPF